MEAVTALTAPDSDASERSRVVAFSLLFIGSAQFYSTDNEAVYFGSLGAATIGIGVVILALSGIITRAMRGVR